MNSITIEDSMNGGRKLSGMQDRYFHEIGGSAMDILCEYDPPVLCKRWLKHWKPENSCTWAGTAADCQPGRMDMGVKERQRSCCLIAAALLILVKA